jgi:hypothetical protein
LFQVAFCDSISDQKFVAEKQGVGIDARTKAERTKTRNYFAQQRKLEIKKQVEGEILVLFYKDN